MSALTDETFNEHVEIPDTENKLTVVMPFLNEGEEVGNTVRSIRATAGCSVDIIVINDASIASLISYDVSLFKYSVNVFI